MANATGDQYNNVPSYIVDGRTGNLLIREAQPRFEFRIPTIEDESTQKFKQPATSLTQPQKSVPKETIEPSDIKEAAPVKDGYSFKPAEPSGPATEYRKIGNGPPPAEKEDG